MPRPGAGLLADGGLGGAKPTGAVGLAPPKEVPDADVLGKAPSCMPCARASARLKRSTTATPANAPPTVQLNL